MSTNTAASQEYTIASQYGLSVRLAAEVVKEAKRYECDITITSNDKSASAKSLFKLQTLEVSPEKPIIIAAHGVDARHAVEDLVRQLQMADAALDESS